MSLYDVAYYQQINQEERPQAERLAEWLIWHYRPKSVIDIGSATGLYLKPFLEQGIKVTGLDYSESVVDEAVLQVPRPIIKIHDITASPVKIKADLAICLEVLEHIEAVHARAAIKNIAGASNLFVFSAAQPGQGGVGHVNCQPPAYWQNLFEATGFKRQYQDENYLKTVMAAGYHMGWLLNNVMVFARN